jgi:RHS repeat-associated protein
MEKDPEMKGEGNSYTTEFRQYDPRLGRWLSLDPLMSMFPDMSPYVAFDNNPVLYVDPYGLASTNGNEGEESGSECDDGNFTLDRSSSGKEDPEGEGRFWTPEGGVNKNYNGPTVDEAAKLANHVYDINKPGFNPGTQVGETGWFLFSEYTLHTESSGYKAALYRKEVDGAFYYAFVTAGTDDFKDLKSDIIQGITGIGEEQYAHSIKDATR